MTRRYQQWLTLTAVCVFAVMITASIPYGIALAAQSGTGQSGTGQPGGMPQGTDPQDRQNQGTQPNQGMGSQGSGGQGSTYSSPSGQVGETNPAVGERNAPNQAQTPGVGQSGTENTATSGGIGWGSLIIGLVIGYLAGMMTGRRRTGITTVDDRFRHDRDRAA
jgi:hypothetical protein